VNIRSCPLYVRAASQSKRLTPRTGTDCVRTGSLICSLTLVAPPTHDLNRERGQLYIASIPLNEADSAATLGG